ncbi:MLO-like protein 12 [Impatiens glandulifera]|uniref:MLO-like protein 12 n=1 Tax=Impatiens glandulifera TaxID=253017 RepID=UPI001FB15A8B|nr:MLO-like protein 12 [Impatiens glandulifera]
MAVESGGSLEVTPTWAVATVCFVLISLSLLIEYIFHLLSKLFQAKRKKSLLRALELVKSELMLLGFLSLLLTVSQKRIANICITKKVAEFFLPCKTLENDENEESKCLEQGKLSLMSRAGVEQLQYLIFVLAFFHVFFSTLILFLGMFKMKRWESWEAETSTFQYQFSTDPRRIRMIHQTSFGKRHLQSWSEHRHLRLPACFLRQFFSSVSRIDYVTLRHGFIMAHFDEGSSFDFQKYLKRALEKDFGEVVGVRYWMWIFYAIFLFLNARVFHNYYWLPFIPLVMLLVVGTKLQSIIIKMCLDTKDRSIVVEGGLLVKPCDCYFWFGNPKLVLHLIHFILFQNSFQMAFFTYTWYTFGLRTCYHETTEDIVIKIAFGLLVHILCGYVTLPLYALVTQMGTSMKLAVFTDGVAKGLERWRKNAKKKIANRPNIPTMDASITSLYTSASFDTIESRSSSSSELDNNSLADGSARFRDVKTRYEEDIVDEEHEIKRNARKLGSFDDQNIDFNKNQ